MHVAPVAVAILYVQGRSARQENTWTRMLAKLEATYCVSVLWMRALQRSVHSRRPPP